MSRFELQARAVVVAYGGRVQRDDTVVDAGDDRAALLHKAHELASQGYTAWLFERGHARGSTAAPLHLVHTATPPATGAKTTPGRTTPGREHLGKAL